MRSSLALRANERVEQYRNSVSVVHDNVLLVKGFLGPSLKDKPELSSVGVRAARAAGVIVDELGKLRCPPGTPNANQFTDMQMSNCMIPGMALAKRAAKRSRREVGQMLDNAKKILDNKKVGSATRVAAMTALATLDALDYWNVDGSGTLSAMTLMGVDLFRTVGRDVADLALNRLERKGKITPEQRKDLDRIIDRLHEVGSSKYTAAVLSKIKRDRRRRNKERLNVPEPENINASAPDTSDRKEGLVKVTFDTDAFNVEMDNKIDKLLDKYVPNSRHKNFDEYADDLVRSMGIPPSRKMSDQADAGVKWFTEGGGKKRLDACRVKIEGENPKQTAVRAELGDQLEKLLRLAETDGGKEAIRKQIERGILESLVGAELMMQDNPSLRGKFTFEVHQVSDTVGFSEPPAGYAYVAAYDDGRIIPATRYYSDAMMFNNVEQGGEKGEFAKGEMFDKHTRIAGADDYQVNLAMHEIAHASHYAEVLRSMGVDSGVESKPIIEQLKGQGSSISDTFVGAQFAISYSLDPNMSWKELEASWDDPALKRQLFGYSMSGDNVPLKKALAEFTRKLVHKNNSNESEKIIGQHRPFLSIESTTEKSQVFSDVLNAVASNNPESFSVNWGAENEFTKMDDVKKILEDALDGQSIEDFIAEGKEAFDAVLGFDSRNIITKGVGRAEIMKTMGSASVYGQTNSWEALAEAKALTMVTKNFPGSKVLDETGFEEMSNMVQKITPNDAGVPKPTIMTPEAKAWILRLKSVIDRLVVPERKSTV